MKLNAITQIGDIQRVVCDARHYDEALDDGRSVIADICETFADTNKIQFIVSGFGSNQWPVDCRFDLPVIIEQLPEIRRKILKEDFNFVLDFYEQGIERAVSFKKENDNVVLECTSRNDWVPDPCRIEMRKDNVSSIFNTLHESFLFLSQYICNDLAKNTLLKEWMGI